MGTVKRPAKPRAPSAGKPFLSFPSPLCEKAKTKPKLDLEVFNQDRNVYSRQFRGVYLREKKDK
jgi:hypothetical protein